MAGPSLLEKLVTALRAPTVDIEDDGCSASGKLPQRSAAILAQLALTIVREHDEERGRPRLEDDVVDAHVCCEHVPEDGELAVLVTVKRELDRLCLKPEGTVRRVLAYLADTYGYVLADED